MEVQLCSNSLCTISVSGKRAKIDTCSLVTCSDTSQSWSASNPAPILSLAADHSAVSVAGSNDHEEFLCGVSVEATCSWTIDFH